MAIPMPGPYETPGVIQEILKRRREESRQAMLDKLNEEQIRASMESDRRRLAQGDEQLQLSKDQFGWNKSLAELGLVPGGTDPSKVNPLVAEMGRRYGLIRDVPSQDPTIVPSETVDYPPSQYPEVSGMLKSGVENPDLPGRPKREEFVGNAEYQQRTRGQEDIDALIERFRDDPDMLRSLMLVRGGALQSVPSEQVGPTPSFTPIDPNTGKAKDRIDLPRGGRADYQPFPPASYTPAFMPWFDPTPTETHPQGRSILVGNRLGAGGTPIVRDMPSTPGAIGPQQPLQRVVGPDTTPDTGLQRAIERLGVAVTNRGANREEGIQAARAGILAAASRTLPPTGQGKEALNYVVDSFGRAQRPPTVADIPAALTLLKQRFPNMTDLESQIIRDTLVGYLSFPIE